MSSSRARHEKLLAQRKREAGELESKTSLVARARLFVFLAVVGVGIAVVWGRLPHVVWLADAALGLLFVVLVVWHAKIHASLERRQAAVRFHELALARMSDRWRSFPSLGERWASETHPYASDLDVFGRSSLFQAMDGTSTRFGEEVLAKWLSGEHAQKAPETAAEAFAVVRERQAAVRDLAPKLELREELAVAGSLLLEDAKPDPRPFVMWAGQTNPGGRLPGWLRIVAVVLPVVSIGAVLASSFGFAPRGTFVVPFGLSLAVLTGLRPKLAPILDAASSKEGALSRFSGMLGLIEGASFEANALRSLQERLRQSGVSATKEMASLARIVGFLDARNNEVFRFFIGPFFMWDLWCALALDAWRARAGRSAFGWFRALAEFEAFASLGAFAFEHSGYAFPTFEETPVFDAKGLGHPLIDGDKRVGNDVLIEGRGYALVVTGSNMSGKSTLLRSIGTNVVLANAGAPVAATSLRLGYLRVATSMRVSDSLEEGTSRFYAELKKLKRVLDLARQSSANPDREPALLFLLDEILHGTNTRERLIGARALLEELLSLGALGAVSTHDLALGELESDHPGRVRNVHFEEQVEDEKMTFDYRLREGVVQSSNALRLMKIVGLDLPTG